MTEDNLQDTNISIEQIVAAIIAKFDKVEIHISDLLKDYSDKNIAVNQDPETQLITFELVEKVQAETE